MANNPLGLQRSGDSSLDLDILFANLQYLRDALPQTTTLGSDITITSSSAVPLHNNLSFPISSRVKFEATVLVTAGSGFTLSIVGPATSILRYSWWAPSTEYVAWNYGATSPPSTYVITGYCEPSAPGILAVTINTVGSPVTVSALSHLTVTLL